MVYCCPECSITLPEKTSECPECDWEDEDEKEDEDEDSGRSHPMQGARPPTRPPTRHKQQRAEDQDDDEGRTYSGKWDDDTPEKLHRTYGDVWDGEPTVSVHGSEGGRALEESLGDMRSDLGVVKVAMRDGTEKTIPIEDVNIEVENRLG